MPTVMATLLQGYWRTSNEQSEREKEEESENHLGQTDAMYSLVSRTRLESMVLNA